MNGYIYLFLMFFTSGFSTVLMKVLLNDNVNPFELQFFTSLISVMIIQIISKGKIYCFPYKYVEKPCFKVSIVTALTGFVIFELSFNLALQYMSVMQTIVLYYLNPIILYFASFIFLKNKRIEKNVIIGIIISFIGVYITVTNGKLFTIGINLRGIFYMFIAILSIVTFIIYSKKNNINESGYLVWGQIISVILCAIVMFITKSRFLPDIRQVFCLIVIAILYNILNTIFYLKAVQNLSVGKLSTLTYLSPVITSILAILILKEPLSYATIIGLILVVFGNLFAHRIKK